MCDAFSESRGALLGIRLALALALIGCGSTGEDEGAAGGDVAAPSGGGTAGTSIVGAGSGGVGGTSSTPLGGTGGTTAPAAGTGGTTVPGEIVDVSCTITPSLMMSPVISTVGIVTFTTDLAGVDGASIEFGLDTNYGFTAPVDLAEPGYRTLLLGMKASREYHYRIVATAGSQRCVGADATLTTGPEPNQPQLYAITVTTPQPDKVAPGFIVGGVFMSGPAFIVDQDGDYVWWYDTGDASRVRMSYDGKYMWIRNVNVMGGNSQVIRVSMDGTQEEVFGMQSEFGDSHHDFTVLPDETVAFIQHGDGGSFGTGCDRIMERAPDGTVRMVVDAQDVHGGTNCHVNSIHYHPEDDTLTFSDLNLNCYAKITRSGEVVWIMGGDMTDFPSGTGANWNRQHGHHLFEPNHMMMFENGSGPGATSKAYELVFDQTAGTVERVWQYQSGSLSSFVLGDVMRLPNGNTLVTFTTAGTIHEVDPDQNLVQSFEFSIGGAVSYTQHRATLYGPPPT